MGLNYYDRDEFGALWTQSRPLFEDARELNGATLFESIVSRFTRALTILVGLAFLGSVSRAWHSGWHPLFDVEIGVVIVIMSLFALRRRIKPRYMALALITASYFVGMTSLLSYGLTGGGGAIILTGVGIICGAVYGRRRGLLVSGLIFISILLFAVGIQTGGWPLIPLPVDTQARAVSGWLNLSIDMFVVAAIAIFCINAIQERLLLMMKISRGEYIFTQAALDAQQDLFLVFDATSKKPIRWNNAVCEFLGLTEEESRAQIIPEDWAARMGLNTKEVAAAVGRVTSGALPYIEFDLLSRENEKVPMEFHAAAVTMPDKRQLTVAIGRDLRDRRAAEKALRESERHFRLITENIPAVVWTLNHAGLPTYISPNVENICGFVADEISKDGLGLWVSRIHADDRERFRTSFIQLLIHKQPIDFKYRFTGKDGREIWLQQRGTPAADPNEEASAYGVFWDITEQVRTAEHLRQSEKLETIGQLAGGVAHDFNNQITAIVGCAELLSLEVTHHPEAMVYVNEIMKCAQHASVLPDQLLTFARRKPENNLPQNVHEMISETVAIVRRSMNKNINFTVQLDADHPMVAANEGQLQNALLNLLLNARDAMPGGGTLTIRTHNDVITELKAERPSLVPGAYLYLSVQDTGEGMGEETKHRIFEPFFTTKPVGKGTGMGLSTVFCAVKELGGEIHVDSQLNQGTTMTLILPGIPLKVVPAPMSRNKGQSDGRRVMLVDDEPEVLRLVSSMLKDMGFEVVSCLGGTQAVTEYRRNSSDYDLVILDMVMPDQSGADTFSALRRLDRRIRVLLASGKATDEEIAQILDRGAMGFLPKPFSSHQLRDKISGIMGDGRGLSQMEG